MIELICLTKDENFTRYNADENKIKPVDYKTIINSWKFITEIKVAIC